MFNPIFCCFWASLLVTIFAEAPTENGYSEEDARNFMKEFDEKAGRLANKEILAAWSYDANITEYNSKKKVEVLEEVAKIRKSMWEDIKKYNWKNFNDVDLQRRFRFASILGAAALPEKTYKDMIETIEAMSTIYSTAKVCDYKNKSNCEMRLEPELTEIMAKSRDPEELKHYWAAWSDASGKKSRTLYKEYIKHKKAEARENGFNDPVAYWNFDFESETFENDISELWEQLRPFYQQFHAYVRNKLVKKYGKDVVSETGPIPAHLLGNMWAQSWGNINDIVNPFYGKTSVTATEEMLKQGYTPLKMAKLAEDFFKSLNLSAMPESFWTNSILERPKDREIVCHASAWDMSNGDDVRIKMCTEVNEEDLNTMHHEMGHIQYFLQYKDQPKVYREGANSGFHEAIGDTIALNVMTDRHMHKIGLKPLQEKKLDNTIKLLFETALDKIAFLPFGFLIDQYRWDILRGSADLENLECRWWELREKYQGVEPPVDRNESDFDAAAKYHVVADVPYIRYFVSFVIQFQFYQSLCIEAGQYDPKFPDENALHECDIYGNTNAGNRLGKVLQMGSSKHWRDAMEVATGQRKMDAGPLLEYFAPLMKWLTKENEKDNVKIGWEPSKRSTCGKNA